MLILILENKLFKFLKGKQTYNDSFPTLGEKNDLQAK